MAKIPVNNTSQRDSIQLMRQDLINQAKTITELTEQIIELKKEVLDNKFANIERDHKRDELKRDVEYLNERLKDDVEQLTTKLDGIYGLGRWILLAFGSLVIAAVTNFMVKGGLNVN